MLWVDRREFHTLVSQLWKATNHCRNADGLLVQGPDITVCRAQAFGALAALMNGPVLSEDTVLDPLRGAPLPPKQETKDV